MRNYCTRALQSYGTPQKQKLNEMPRSAMFGSPRPPANRSGAGQWGSAMSRFVYSSGRMRAGVGFSAIVIVTTPPGKAIGGSGGVSAGGISWLNHKLIYSLGGPDPVDLVCK